MAEKKSKKSAAKPVLLQRQPQILKGEGDARCRRTSRRCRAGSGWGAAWTR